MKAIDAHCHADMLVRFVSDFSKVYRDMELGGITWSYNEDITSFRSYPAYWDELLNLCKKLTEEGIPFFYLVGIHPRSIPEDLTSIKKLPPEITDSLAKHLEDPLCLGMGELGLDTGTLVEEKILRLQIEWAEDNLPRRKRIGIHTPRQNKEKMTEKLLRLLEDYEPLHPFMIIEHVTPTTYDMVFGEGYVAGVTLQKGKSSPEDLLAILKQYPKNVKTILVNSDGARELSQTYLEWVDQHEQFDEEQFKALAMENAIEFWQIPGEAI